MSEPHVDAPDEAVKACLVSMNTTAFSDYRGSMNSRLDQSVDRRTQLDDSGWLSSI